MKNFPGHPVHTWVAVLHSTQYFLLSVVYTVLFGYSYFPVLLIVKMIHYMSVKCIFNTVGITSFVTLVTIYLSMTNLLY